MERGEMKTSLGGPWGPVTTTGWAAAKEPTKVTKE